MFYDLPDASIIFAAVLVVQPARLRIGRRGGIGIAQQGLDAGQYGGYVVNRRPLVLQNIQADLSVIVDVGMEHFCEKPNLRCLIGIVLRKLEHQFEGSPLPRRVVGPKDDGLPQHDVSVHRGARYSRRRVILQADGLSGLDKIQFIPFVAINRVQPMAHGIGK